MMRFGNQITLVVLTDLASQQALTLGL